MKDVISSMKLIRESRYIPTEAKREFDAVMPLVERFGELGPNARRVLLALADRLVAGKAHGDFDKPHDWDKESSEEALDLAVYQAAKLLGLGKAEEPKLQTAREYTAPDGTRVSLDGRTIDGKPWVPPPGARVRVVYRVYDDVEPFTGEVIIIHGSGARKHDDNTIVVNVNGLSRLMRVVPA